MIVRARLVVFGRHSTSSRVVLVVLSLNRETNHIVLYQTCTERWILRSSRVCWDREWGGYILLGYCHVLAMIHLKTYC